MTDKNGILLGRHPITKEPVYSGELIESDRRMKRRKAELLMLMALAGDLIDNADLTSDEVAGVKRKLQEFRDEYYSGLYFTA